MNGLFIDRLLSRAAAFALLLSTTGPLSAEGLLCGTAEVDISPTVTPFQLRSGRSSHVHDPLHVRAIALQNDTGCAAIALVDAIGVGRDWTDEAKRIASEQTGWPPEVMLVCATHTHSAAKGGDSSPGRIAYETLRREGIALALVRAIESREPAKIGFASDEEPGEVRNRRWFLREGSIGTRNPLGEFDQVRTNGGGSDLLKPAGPVDPEVGVIDIRTRGGRPLGLIANYALHYVGGIPRVVDENGRSTGMASADYFGEFSRIMPYRIAGARPAAPFVALMTNGASGDINNLPFTLRRPPRAPFEQIRLVASKTADAAWRAIGKIESYDESPPVAVLQREVTLNYRQPSAEEVARALRLLEMTRKDREEIHQRTTSVATRTVEFASPEFERTEEVLIQAIRIGDQAIVSLPFEVLVEIGLEIKEKSPFPHTMVIGLANGSYGYLPNPRQFDLGGYETWLGTCRFERESSDTLTEHLLDMLDRLRSLGDDADGPVR